MRHETKIYGTEAAPLSLAGILQLRLGRAHELCGPARRLLALWALAAVQGPVLWIRPRWDPDRLAPTGMAPWINPERLILLDVARDADALACAEEALRSGAMAGVVMELSGPPLLTPLRRLHLAAETGYACRSASGLLGLLLTPEEGGTAGVESRWHLAPCPAQVAVQPITPSWTLRRLRARMAPQAAWTITEGHGNEITLGPRARLHARCSPTLCPV